MALLHGFGRSGEALDLLGRPLALQPDTMPGLTITQAGDTPMANKAPYDGVYTLDGNRFWIQVGAPLPDGAVMDEAEPVSVVPIEEEWVATDQAIEGVEVPAIYVQSTPIQFDADQLESLGLVADPDKLKNALGNGEFGSLVAVWVKTSTEPSEGFGPLGEMTGAVDGEEENISLASDVGSDEETPVIDPADLKPIEDAVVEPINEPAAKPKRGKKSAPETPEGAGPVIETPEDGASKPETPEGATE